MKGTLTLADAVRLTGPAAFSLMLKPAGSLCNLDCAYCYYLDKADIYGGVEPRMSLEGLERFVKAYIEACEVPEVVFNWHGGEPCVMGLDFYRKAVAFEKKYAGGKTIKNTFQTNGTLLDDGWARFFADEDFLIGISVDGPESIHDRYRKDKGGAPSFARVMKGVETLYRNKAQYNLMATVSHAGEGHGMEVYNFLKSLGTAFIQFSPVVEHVRYPSQDGLVARRIKNSRPVIVDPHDADAVLAPWSVSGLGFGTFLCDVFDSWLSAGDVGRVFVNWFDATLANMCGVMPATCSFAETCGGNAVVEHNGDVYCCDHFVYPQYKIGNIFHDKLSEMMASPQQTAFGIAKRNSLPGDCLRCEFFALCHGGCPKHRFERRNYLCDGYRKFFRHTQKYFSAMRDDLLASAER